MPPDHLPASALSRRAQRTLVGTQPILSAVLPAAGLVPAASTVIAVALPPIMDEFALSTSAIGWLVTGYLLLVAALQPLAGRFGDRAGHHRAVVGGSLLLAAASLAAAFVPAPVPLVVARLFQGVAGAFIVPNSLALVRRDVRGDDRDRAVGVLLATMALASVVGVAGGGALVAAVGWRAPFGVLAVLAGAAAGAAGSLRAPPTSGSHFHALDRPLRAPRRAGSGFASAAAGIGLANLALYVVLLALPLRLDALGWSAATSGGALATFVGASAVGSYGADRVGVRLGRRRSLLVADILAAAALVLVALAPVRLVWLLPALIGAGTGLGVVMSGLFSAGIDAADHEHAGASSGLLTTSRYVGSIVGSATVSGILAITGHAAALLLAPAAAAAVVAPLRRGSRLSEGQA